jgi:hypothetical protein
VDFKRRNDRIFRFSLRWLNGHGCCARDDALNAKALKLTGNSVCQRPAGRDRTNHLGPLRLRRDLNRSPADTPVFTKAFKFPHAAAPLHGLKS